MHNYEGIYTAGKWRGTGGERLEVMSPADGSLVGTVTVATAADVDVAVRAARTALDRGPWATATPGDRADALDRLADALQARTKEFATLLSLEVGTPRKAATFTQAGLAIGVLRASAKLAREYRFEDVRPTTTGGEVLVRQLPVGVVGAILPWNVPLFTAALKLGPALAAGCTIVLKPSPDAPLGLSLFMEVVEAAGIPDGVINLVSGEVATGEALVAHPDVDKISFTGSTVAGRRIGAVCAEQVRRCTLELGGKSAAVLLDDVVFDDALIGGVVTGVMANNGQVCAAQTRILVSHNRYDEFVTKFSAAVDALVVGDPADRETDVGPVINAAARDRIERHVRDAVAAGARVAAGGSRPEGLESGWYLRPTVLVGVDNAMPIARQELFGPVAVVIAYADEDDAVSIANDSEYGLAGAVWSADRARAAQVATRLRTGTVSVNSPAPLDFGSPFGGFKKSGIGREGGPEGIAAYLEPQSIIL